MWNSILVFCPGIWKDSDIWLQNDFILLFCVYYGKILYWKQ